MKVHCSRGVAEIDVGTEWSDGMTRWRVVALIGTGMYSPSGLGGTPVFACVPVHGEPDGTVDFCGDSIAASMLYESQQEQPQ